MGEMISMNEIKLEELSVYQKVVNEREGAYADFPSTLAQELQAYLTGKGIAKLYTHQAQMYELAHAGENVVITTSTASGKTLSFLLPVLQEILTDPQTRAIFVYPTKALASDQFRVLTDILKFFGDGRIQAGVYDGDTLPAERTRIRRSANIILTNPEMLNASFLPNHSKYGFDAIFANLKYIVIDELHSYRGAFGAHMANIFRRMKRVCTYYKAKPQFLCSSATIANPQELAGHICGVEFTLIDKDGSPAPKKEYHILQSPAIRGTNDQIYGRIPAATVAAELVPQLVEEERHFIAFGKSRRSVEVVLKESRDKLDAAGFLGKGDSSRIAGYRGGYTPLERRAIEQKMIRGDLLGLISTNALELGIDIGTVDTTLLVGYPGTRASFWQRTGRAGRSHNTAVNYMILENEPFDQYIAIEPDWLFAQQSEHAIVDPDNLLIQLAHVRAAAAEMPLTMDDITLFPDLGEIIPVLMKAEEVKMLSGRFAWAGPAFPAGDYSLRNMDKTRYKLILKEEGRTITEMDESQAFHEIYPGAVYLHDGELYEVLRLDLVSRTAEAKAFEGNYYTVPAGEKDTRILNTMQESELGRVPLRFGDININDIVMMFKKLQFHNHQNLGYVDLTVPLQKDYDTESTWLRIPENVVSVYRRLVQRNGNGMVVRNNHFEGIAHAIRSAAMMVTMTAQDDIDTVVSNNAVIPDEQEDETVSLYLYDRYEGGLGYAEKIYDLMPQILDQAIRMVKGCKCRDGCPACVGDYTLDRGMVLWGLENFYEETPAPEHYKALIDEAKQTEVRRQYSFFKLDTFLRDSQWYDLCQSVVSSGDGTGTYLKMIRSAKVEGHKLTLYLDSSFYVEWLSQPENLRSLTNTLRYHAICPADMQVSIRQSQLDDEARKEQEKKRQKLGRKMSEQ